MWNLGRISGMLAFLFLALSIFGGVYKIFLIRHFGARNVKYSHSIISYTAFALVFVHLFTLLFDNYYWGPSLSLYKLFLPTFGNNIDNNLSLGVFGLYLMTIGVLGCIFFKLITKKFGFKVWLWVHRLTLVSYALVYIHAWKIGTDFRNPIYMAAFPVFFLAILGKYAYDFRNRKSGKVFSPKDLVRQNYMQGEPMDISYIKLEHPKDAIIKGFMKFNKNYNGLNWFTIYDNTGYIYAYCSRQIASGTYKLKGKVVVKKGQVYFNITGI